MEKAIEAAKNKKVDDPLLPDTENGPQISEE
jgi:acyl-CoA reductase-like NAD-dependent aldehyde dehydrogenase